MNPTLPQQNQQSTAPSQGQFTPQHNQMYENLRNVLMQLHQTGMPGIDKVLNTLNQAHISQMKPPTMPQQTVQGASTQMQTQNNQPNLLLQAGNAMQQGVMNPPKLNMANRIPPIIGQMMANAPKNIENLSNTPANSMQSAGKLGQDIRTPGTSPMQYGQDAWGAAQLPLLLASLAMMNGSGQVGQEEQTSTTTDQAMQMQPDAQALINKIQSQGYSSLTPEEKIAFQKIPIADLQEMHTGVPQVIEKQLTHQAINQPTYPPIFSTWQDALLKKLVGGDRVDFPSAIYNAMQNVKL